MSKIPSKLKKLLDSKGRGRIGFRYLDLGLWKSIGRPPYSVVLMYHVSNIINPGLKPLHVHYWYQPSSCTGANFGFFKGTGKTDNDGIYNIDGIYQDHVKDVLKKYTFIGPSYSNLIMGEVKAKLKDLKKSGGLASSGEKKWGPGQFREFHNNCHHFMQEAIKAYDLILQEKTKQYHRSVKHFRRTFGGAV